MTKTLNANLEKATAAAAALGHRLSRRPGPVSRKDGDGRHWRYLVYCENHCGYTVTISTAPHALLPVAGPAVKYPCQPGRLRQPGKTYLHTNEAAEADQKGAGAK